MIFPVVLSLEVVEDVAGLADHFQQPATGMMVLEVRLEVVGQPVYPGREQCDLHFRGTRIARRALVLLDDLRLLRNAYPHALLSLCVFAKGRYFILKSAPSTSCFEVNARHWRARRRLGCNVRHESTSPVPRNTPSSPKTATFPLSEMTEPA